MNNRKKLNQRFISAMRFLKDYYGISYASVYDRLEMGRGRWNSIQKNAGNVNDWEIKKLQELYPDTKKYFEESYIVEEIETSYSTQAPLKEYSILLKYIESLEAQIELYKQQLSAKEAEEQYQKLLIEVKELLKHKHPD